MISERITYFVFGIVLLITVIIDLGLLSKRSIEIDFKKALFQTLLWVLLAIAFFCFLWWYYNTKAAIGYISAYLMEWSLSIDNIFVFILIFSFFQIRSDHVARALLTGILLAILLRVLFITAGVALVKYVSWILYLFGAFLFYTGIKLFAVKKQEAFDPQKSAVYKYINRLVPVVHQDISGKLWVRINGRRFFTNLFVVIVLLATTDIVFALDSIPAVFAISQDKMVIYTSNIFAVLGLRSLFFLLRGAFNRFDYLQQGIAFILVFIGLKMLGGMVHIKIPDYISLVVIVICLFGSILYSVQFAGRKIKE